MGRTGIGRACAARCANEGIAGTTVDIVAERSRGSPPANNGPMVDYQQGLDGKRASVPTRYASRGDPISKPSA